MKRKMLGAVASLGLSLAFLVGSAASASAITGYQHQGFGGSYLHFSGPGNHSLVGMEWISGPGAGQSMNNSISSFKNDDGKPWYLYDGSSCTGTYYYARPYSEDSNLSSNSNNPSNFDNKTSCLN